jgi:hypothetical protein
MICQLQHTTTTTSDNLLRVEDAAVVTAKDKTDRHPHCRAGKWSLEEEAFASSIVCYFQSGLLNIEVR